MSKKILFIIPNFGFGGAQRIFSDHAKLLAKDYDVEECVFSLEEENFYPTGNDIRNLNIPAGKNFPDKIRRFFQRVKKVSSLKKANNYDISISHLEGADYVNVLSKQSDKVILVIHGSKLADENMNGVIGWLRKNVLLPVLYKRADLIVSTSDAIKVELENHYGISPDKITSIPNFFDIDVIVEKSLMAPNDLVEELKKKFQLILYSGRFANQKNLFPLFYIFKEIKEQTSTVKLIISGDGELKEDLLSLCRQLGLTYYWPGDEFNESYDIYFLGYQRNPFVIIRQCDLFVMTSKWEGFPMALCEALAVGSCVISSDCPTGPSQILAKDRNGERPGSLLPIPLVEEKETLQIWVDEINSLLKDPKKRAEYLEKGKIRVKDFSKDTIGEKWKTIIMKDA